MLLGIYDDNGTPVIDLVEINDRTGATNVLASIPLADINTTGANEIAFSLDYVPPQNASDNSPSAEPVTASFQLLYNGVDVGSAQTMSATATIFGSSEDFTIPFFGAKATAPDSQGAYGDLGIVNGQWGYVLNGDSVQQANYQALALGQTATDAFNITLADSNGGSASEPVNISVVGVGAGA